LCNVRTMLASVYKCIYFAFATNICGIRLLGRIAIAEQAIPPIPTLSTHFSVAWSLCRLFVTFVHLFKPFDGFRCHSERTHTCGVQWQVTEKCVRWGPWPPDEGEICGSNPNQNMQLQIAAKPSVLCCHLANTNEELGGLTTAIPHFAKLIWSLFNIGLCVVCRHWICTIIKLHCAIGWSYVHAKINWLHYITLH